jgi:hypothetical protein
MKRQLQDLNLRGLSHEIRTEIVIRVSPINHSGKLP